MSLTRDWQDRPDTVKGKAGAPVRVSGSVEEVETMYKNFTSVIAAIFLLAGCTADELTPVSSLGPWKSPEGVAQQMTVEEYNKLTYENQYKVANKLLGTVYKGIPASEFFDLSQGTRSNNGRPALKLNPEYYGFLEKAAASLGRRVTGLENIEEIETRILDTDRHLINRSEMQQVTGMPLVEMHEFPLSRDLFERWIAYTLANTILFSPAGELETTTPYDVKRLYRRLLRDLGQNATISQMVFNHEVSLENWRRFRSPEDNTREMIEIYMGLFDRDEDVPKASRACQNWYLAPQNASEPYALQTDGPVNRLPQLIFEGVVGSDDGIWVTSCEEFYQAVASHPLVMPRMVTVLVNRFFPNDSSSRRAAISQSIIQNSPTTFQEIFASILLSREYLMNGERPLSYEEVMLNMGGRLHGQPGRDYFESITDLNGSNKTLVAMGQPAMQLKLGRWKDQPLDSLSFAFFHKSIREDLMLGSNSSRAMRRSAALIEAGTDLTTEEYLDYLFLSVVSRFPTEEERVVFLNIDISTGVEPGVLLRDVSGTLQPRGRAEQTTIILDYLSRLSEVYMQSRI